MSHTQVIKPYKFEHIPRYTRAQAHVWSRFVRYLQAPNLTTQWIEYLEQSLAELVNKKTYVELRHFDIQEAAQIKKGSNDYQCYSVFSLEDQPNAFLVELDPLFLQTLMSELLSGQKDTSLSSRHLSDIERAIVDYALLKSLHGVLALHSAQQGTYPMVIKLIQSTQDINKLKDTLSDHRLFYVLHFSVHMGDISSQFKIIIATDAINQLSSELHQDLSLIRKNLARVGDQWLVGRVRIATLDLTLEDMRTLSLGDIVLLENHTLSLPCSQLGGHATLFLGTGKNGSIKTQFLWRHGRADLQITQIDQTKEAQVMSEHDLLASQDNDELEEVEAVDVENSQTPENFDPQDNLQETEGLLRDVPAPVSVELARIKMNTSQVIRLQVGQILRLGRSPGDPVDLIVNQRIFARGELIEVDGEIGVRLTQLAK